MDSNKRLGFSSRRIVLSAALTTISLLVIYWLVRNRQDIGVTVSAFSNFLHGLFFLMWLCLILFSPYVAVAFVVYLNPRLFRMIDRVRSQRNSGGEPATEASAESSRFRRAAVMAMKSASGIVFFAMVFLLVLLLAFVTAGPAWCSDRSTEFPSPDGQHIAVVTWTGCGGAAGATYNSVSVKPAKGIWPWPKTVFSAGRTAPAAEWKDDRTLYVTYFGIDHTNVEPEQTVDGIRVIL